LKPTLAQNEHPIKNVQPLFGEDINRMSFRGGKKFNASQGSLRNPRFGFAGASWKRRYRVFTTLTGRAGIEIFRDQPFDAVILPYWMVDMDGLEVATELKKA